MKLAVLSDIHGNLEALERVLEDVRLAGCDRIAALGDNIGYGPDPEAVTARLMELGIASVKGNHELGLLDTAWLKWFNPSARQALISTRDMLSPESITWLAGLPDSMVAAGVRLVHGFPPDSAVKYLFEASDRDMADVMQALPERVALVGHTHETGLVSVKGRKVKRLSLPRVVTGLGAGARHIVNVGSVGQPRDGDARAKYVILDADAGSLELRAVDYDYRETAHKIIEKGLPEIYARRLAGL